MPSISMLLREWAMQSIELGTRPSWAGERSVVRTRHQSGLSWGLSTSSTVWPLRTVNSDPLLAMKSWMTTVNSEPPDNCGGRHKVTLKIQIHAIKTTNMTKKQAYRTYPLVMWHCQWAQKVSHWPWTFTSHVSTKTTPPGMSLRRKHHTEEWSGSKKNISDNAISFNLEDRALNNHVLSKWISSTVQNSSDTSSHCHGDGISLKEWRLARGRERRQRQTQCAKI